VPGPVSVEQVDRAVKVSLERLGYRVDSAFPGVYRGQMKVPKDVWNRDYGLVVSRVPGGDGAFLLNLEAETCRGCVVLEGDPMSPRARAQSFVVVFSMELARSRAARRQAPAPEPSQSTLPPTMRAEERLLESDTDGSGPPQPDPEIARPAASGPPAPTESDPRTESDPSTEAMAPAEVRGRVIAVRGGRISIELDLPAQIQRGALVQCAIGVGERLLMVPGKWRVDAVDGVHVEAVPDGATGHVSEGNIAIVRREPAG
jgi:hypothetical protein